MLFIVNMFMRLTPTTQPPETHPNPPEGRELDVLLLVVCIGFIGLISLIGLIPN